MSPPNDVCDDEYVEQYQEYDVRNHVCYSIACVEEWAQYRNMWQMSTDQCDINDIYVAHHLYTDGHVLHLYVGYVARLTPRPPPLKKVVIIHIV